MLTLKEFNETYFDALISHVNSESELIRFAGPYFTFPLTTNQLSNYLNDSAIHPYTIFYGTHPHPIGHAEINKADNHLPKLCRLFIYDSNFRNRGIGQELVKTLLKIAFTTFDSDTIELNVYDWNFSAINCYKKAGFEINPNLTSEIIVEGLVWNSVNMRVKRDKYYTCKKS